MIPQSVIEELKYRCPIDEVISSYVTLKRAGSNLNGLCPFHSEKTPSFTVFPATSSFYCFGCGAGGDVISFIMRSENLSYREALEFLAKRAGIALPDDDVKRGPTVSRQRIYDMNVSAAKFFRSALYDENVGGIARAYIAKRGLSEAIVKRFGLGYADGDYHSLYNHLRREGYTDEEMEQGFLCRRSDKSNTLFDLFRNRLMFPIIDSAGRVIAFGGRVLDDSKPKYLNSSDTPVFNKKRNLFALNYAKNSCAEQMILCEGYMDVIALHEAGFENAVATLGTAITPDQARLLAKHTKKVIISYDNDEAGQNAAEKAFRLIGEVGLDTRLLRVEGAKDPDEYIRKYGREKFREMLEGSRTRFEYTVARILSEHDINIDSEKIKAANRICGYISSIHSSVERDIYCAKAAEILSLDAESIKRDVNRTIKKRINEAKRTEHDALVRTTSGLSDRVNPDYAKKPRAGRLEEHVLGLILLHPEYTVLPVDGEAPSEGDFFSALAKRLFSTVADAFSDGGFDFGQLSEDFTQEEVSRAMKMRLSREELSDNGPAVFAEELRGLRREMKADVEDDFAAVIARRQKSLNKTE